MVNPMAEYGTYFEALGEPNRLDKFWPTCTFSSESKNWKFDAPWCEFYARNRMRSLLNLKNASLAYFRFNTLFLPWIRVESAFFKFFKILLTMLTFSGTSKKYKFLVIFGFILMYKMRNSPREVSSTPIEILPLSYVFDPTICDPSNPSGRGARYD